MAQARKQGRLRLEGLSCVNDLHCDADGALWLCADNGIAVYVDGSIRVQNLLMNNSVDEMLVDAEGNYWFVSSRQGVLEVSRSKFGNVSQSAGLDSMVVNAIQRIGDTLYIGHDSGLVTLNAADLKKTAAASFDRLNATRVRALLADSNDNLWIGTMKKGLLCYTPEGEMLSYTTDNCPALRSDNFRTVTETNEGILTGTDVGAYLVSGGELRSVTDDPEALAFRILSAVKFGDTICLGSDGNGLYLVSGGRILRHITTDDGLSSNVIMKAYWSEAYDGVWLVTGNNIDFLARDGGITSIENFPSTNNLDLLLMQNGDAWVLTGSGIYQTTEQSLLHDAEPKYLQFRRADGLPFEVTPNAYQCRTDDLLYVCGSGGVFTLQTDFARSETGDFQLVVDSVVADGQPVYAPRGGTCTLEASVKRVDINAFVLTYQNRNPFVFYYLEGFDDGETVAQLSSLGDISYTNLNGGSYTFHFGVKDYATGEVLREITLPIVKQYPWYARPWARLSAVLVGLLLLAAATLLIIRARSRRIERALQQEYEQKERTHLKEIAYKDYLTGLYNRNYLEVWNEELSAEDFPVTFVSIDMNDLKKVNDSYGHAEGDRLLCAMAELLKRCFAEDRFTVVRTGGDEFLVLARGTDGETIRARLDRLAEEAARVSVNDIPVTFGCGMCVQRQDEFNFDDGLRLSDMELLENKNRYHKRTVS